MGLNLSVSALTMKKEYHDTFFVAARCVLQKLDKALKSSLRSDLEDVSLALLMSPAHFDAYLFRKATKV